MTIVRSNARAFPVRCACFLAIVLASALASAACGKAPPFTPPAAPQIPSITIAAPVEAKVKASMNIAAGADLNPDASGRPSPVVLRIYQLKTDALFSSADYFALLGDDQMALGQELLSRDEYTLVPSERRSVDVVVSNETRFVGAFAAFRDSRNAQWRALIPAPRRGFAVSVERGRVVLTPSE